MKHQIKRIISYLSVSVLVFSTAAVFNADATSPSRAYLKYDFSSNTTETYTLTISEPSSSTNRSNLGVINGDDRFRDGHDGIVYLSTGGTGFIVDDHVIATAAHCISNFTDEDLEGTHYFIPDLEIYLYNDSGVFNGTKLTPIEAHVPQGRNTTASVQKQRHDYALLTVAEDLSTYTHFDLGYVYDVDNTNSTNIPVFLSGFPQSVVGTDNSNNVTAPLLYTGAGHICAPYHPDDRLLYYNADATQGNSGGPVYVVNKFIVGNDQYIKFTAISLSGIASTNYNWGPRFDSNIIQFYLQNPNISF